MLLNFNYELCYWCSTTQIKACPHGILTQVCVLYVVTNCWCRRTKKESWRIHTSSLVTMCILNRICLWWIYLLYNREKLQSQYDFKENWKIRGCRKALVETIYNRRFIALQNTQHMIQYTHQSHLIFQMSESQTELTAVKSG